MVDDPRYSESVSPQVLLPEPPRPTVSLALSIKDPYVRYVSAPATEVRGFSYFVLILVAGEGVAGLLGGRLLALRREGSSQKKGPKDREKGADLWLQGRGDRVGGAFQAVAGVLGKRLLRIRLDHGDDSEEQA